MAVENVRNRDLFIKMWFMFYLVHVFRALGIKEEINDILPTEGVIFKNIERPKIFNQFLDFKVLTKSEKIILFEFKKDRLIINDFKQFFEYYKPEFCKNGENTKAIFIVISKGGKVTEYQVANIKFCPEIIKTKEINKQQDLKVIRDKFKSNEVLTSKECSMLIAFPLFDIDENEDVIVEEICGYIEKKSYCIPSAELDNVVAGMYLNVVEYIEFKKQDELLEKIDMESKTEGVIQSLINHGRKTMLDELLENHSRVEVAEFLGISLTELNEMIK